MFQNTRLLYDYFTYCYFLMKNIQSCLIFFLNYVFILTYILCLRKLFIKNYFNKNFILYLFLYIIIRNKYKCNL